MSQPQRNANDRLIAAPPRPGTQNAGAKEKKKVYNITWMLSNDVCAATEWSLDCCFASLPKQKKKKKKKCVII